MKDVFRLNRVRYDSIIRVAKKKVLRDVGVLTLAAILQKGVSLLLLPLYISVLSPAEYGQIDFAATLVMLINIFVQFGLPEALFTEYYHHEERERARIVSRTIFAYLLIAVPFYALSFIVFSLAGKLLIGVEYSQTALLLILSAGFVSFLQTIFLTYLRLVGRANTLALYTLCTAVCGIALNLLFVYFLRIGTQGVFLSNFIVAIGGAVFVWAYMAKAVPLSIEFSLRQTIGIMKIGYPFIFTGLSYWLTNGADRWIIIRILGEENLGIYSLASKFAFMLQPLLVAPTLSALTKPVFNRFSQGNYNIHVRVIFLTTGVIFGVLALAITSLTYFFVAHGQYQGACGLVPMFVVGVGFNFLSQYFANPLVYHQQVRLMLLNILAAGVANVIFNFFLIHKMGIEGAAYAFLSGNIVWAFLTYWQSSAYVKRHFGQSI